MRKPDFATDTELDLRWHKINAMTPGPAKDEATRKWAEALLAALSNGANGLESPHTKAKRRAARSSVEELLNLDREFRDDGFSIAEAATHHARQQGFDSVYAWMKARARQKGAQLEQLLSASYPD